MHEDFYKKYQINVNTNDKDFDSKLKSADIVRRKSKQYPDSHEILSPNFPVMNQGELGSCVGCSGALVQTKEIKLSALWLYKLAKLNDEFNGESYSGTSITGACNALYNYGMCSEALLNYTINENIDLTEAHYNDASQRKIKGYYTLGLNNIDSLRDELLNNKKIWLSFAVHSEFYTAYNDGFIKDEINYLSTAKSGGHAVALVGWITKNSKLYWKFQNSWGVDFGDRGYFYMSNELLSKISQGGYIVVNANEEMTLNRTIFNRIKMFIMNLISKFKLIHV